MGRSILSNVMICQDLVKMYKRKATRDSYLLKLDLKEAYDTINWDFVQQMLEGIGAPSWIMERIMVCVKTPRFSIMLNGVPCGFFGGYKGLRQGDPMYLLFALCMDYLDKILCFVSEQEGFKYHARCKELKLVYLCFADHLLLSCNGDFRSIYTMLQGM